MKKARVLVIDDEASIRSILSALLKKNGYAVKAADSGESGLDAYAEFMPSVVLLDLKMPGIDGMEVMEALDKRLSADSKIIIMTAHGEVRSAVEAMKKGAFDYLQKPFDNDELLAIISRATEMVRLTRRVKQLEDQLQQTYGFENIVGVSNKMKSIFALMHKFAATDGTVLVWGESGTGKELIVRAIHQASKRKSCPFIVVNCGAIPAHLIESEFFGHEAGSFTDAKQLRVGKFEAADGGTLFLDEIGELPLEAQVKLLRVIEEGNFHRVGGTQPIAVDVRVMAATNRDLAIMLEQGTFREDLYWRLNVLSLNVCPLRQRKEDIPLLVEYFLQKFATPLGVEHPAVSGGAMELLTAYEWPGNIRELQNCIYSAMTVAAGSSVEPADLPSRICSEEPDEAKVEAAGTSLAEIAGKATEQAEREAIQNALAKTGGNREKAAELLGIGRKTLYRKFEQYGIK
ncbi:MAG: sigma-54-dependent Fis family transcriptional regulator [Phycisphaerales bacterium]|nr:MAG: sigma-54-dependent Fis family transcriptional regulator [Phycisphaerales bacterium]